jgi:competence protein ComFC
VSGLSSFFIDVLFPQLCVQCETMGSFLCKRCLSKITYYDGPIEIKIPDLALDEVWSLAEYKEPIASAVTTLKYQSIKGVGEMLGAMLAKRFSFSTSTVITAVPLHKKRKAERGFNQAEVIAKELAKQKQLPYIELLKRKRATTSQVVAGTREARLSQLSGAFECNQNIDFSFIKNNEIILIDDVLTTGATLNECAQVLKAVNATKVVGLTVAHGK